MYWYYEKHFKKELVMTKKDNENFKNSTKCWICDNVYVENDVKVRNHWHITVLHRVIFHNLKNCDSHLIMQELVKFKFKVNVTSNGLKKYMSFSNNNKLIFIDSFQFLKYSLDILVKKMSKNDFKYLTQEFDSNVFI